jgi:hypothetical protein
MSMYGDTLEAVLREAERAFNETKENTRGVPSTCEHELGADAVRRIAKLILVDKSSVGFGLGGYTDYARLWRGIAGIALRHAACCEMAAARLVARK